MAVIFSKSAGHNDGLWKDIDRALIAVMQDVDNEKNKDDMLVNVLFNVKKSKRFGEKTSGITSFANFDIVDEGDSAPLDDLSEGFAKLIEHKQFMKKFVCTAEMAEDSIVDEMKTTSANFIRAYKRSRAQFASKALTGQGTSFVYGTTTIDKTTGDGEGLFATAHKSKKSGHVDQCNVFTNDFGNNTNLLNQLANLGRNFCNDAGQTMGYDFDTIVIPANTPDLEDVVKRVIRSDLMIGTSLNDANTQKGLWDLVIDHHWQVPQGKHPFVLVSKQANRELMGNIFYDRVGLKVMNKVDLDTHNLEWSGRCRFSAGFNNWRQVIMGGADTGETLA